MVKNVGAIERSVKPPSTGLLKNLNALSAACIVLCTMVGTGIFLKPGEMAADAGSVSLVFAAFVVGGALALFGALCYAELGAAIPQAGGEYIYLTRAFGPRSGFLFGWMHCLIARPASAAAIAAGCSRFVEFLFPVLNTPISSLRIHVHNFNGELTIRFVTLITIFLLALMTFVNYLGLRLGAHVQVTLTLLKISVILAIIVGGAKLSFGHRLSLSPFWPTSFGWTTWKGLLAALGAALWAYDGWNNLNLVGSEVRDPSKTFPRVISVSVGIVILLFLSFTLICFWVLPYATVSSSPHIASDLVTKLGGSRAGFWLTLGMAISALGTLNASVLSGARVDYAMSLDGLFFPFARTIHPKFHTPGNALIFQCCIAQLMALTGTFEELTSLVIFAIWIFYGMTGLALLRLRRTEPNLIRPYRTWGYPVVPAVFIVAAAAVVTSLWFSRPVRCSIALLVMLMCLPFFDHLRASRTRAQSQVSSYEGRAQGVVQEKRASTGGRGECM